MIRQVLIWLADKSTSLALTIGSVDLMTWFWNWHYELTAPEQRALSQDGER